MAVLQMAAAFSPPPVVCGTISRHAHAGHWARNAPLLGERRRGAAAVLPLRCQEKDLNSDGRDPGPIPRKMSERDADELAKQRMQKMLKLAPPEKYTVVDLGEFGEDLRSTQTLTRGWFEADTILGELTSDDGIPVSQLSNRQRTNWWVDLYTTFNSRVLDRISNRMAFTIAWCIAVTAAIQVGDRTDTLGDLTVFLLPGWPHELVGGFLSILLVFRTDQAYDRFWEGRRRWAHLQASCRDLGRLVLTNMEGPVVELLLAHTAVFPVTLKQHLRGRKNRAEIAAVLNTYLPANSTYIAKIADSKSMPLTVLLSMSTVASELRRAPRAASLDVVWQRVEEKISELAEVLSECEKLKCSPIPISYSRQASRFYSFYTLSLPFALVKDTSPWLVPPICAFIAWVLFVTEEIGHVIEEPFGSGLSRDPDDPVAVTMSDRDLKEIFDRIDSDKSGLIEAEDLARELLETTPTGAAMGDDELQRLMSMMDLNGDGVIDYEEFRQSYTLATGTTRVEMKQLEALPLGMYCDAIIRELLYHWHSVTVERQRQATTDAAGSVSSVEERKGNIL